MHPINKTFFGTHGVMVRYYNGSALVNGYVVKQLGVKRYLVTDGTNPKICFLAQNSTEVSGLGSGEPNVCSMLLNNAVLTATGATFVVTYAIDASTTIVSGGLGWTTADAMVISGGVRPIGTLTFTGIPAVSSTISLGGTTVTFVASGATGLQVNIAGTALLTAANLLTFLTGSADGNISLCNYANNSGVITLISKTTGTTNNAFVLASSATSNILISGATLTGGAANAAGTGPTITATAAGGVVTGLTVAGGASGSYTTLPTNPVFAYFSGNNHTPLQLTLKAKILSITVSGGSGYALNQVLIFNGLVATSQPTAHVSSATSNATSVVIDANGTGITTGASSVSVGSATTEHVKILYDSVVQTVEGNHYSWNLGSSLNNLAVISKYS